MDGGPSSCKMKWSRKVLMRRSHLNTDLKEVRELAKEK